MRQLTSEELPLVSFLFKQTRLGERPDGFMVEPMNDGGMGSLAFAPVTKSRMFGRQAAEFVFEDQDGVPVTAALYLDQHGVPLEMDVFKGDFSVLKQWPLPDALPTEDSRNNRS